jgi:uncharacterized repeat protein (TIGR03803 family)
MRLIRTLVFCLLPSVAAAQPVQLLHTFTRPPVSPDGGLVEAPDGSFYGVTSTGIIRLSPAGQVVQVVRLPDSTAEGPLVRASNGALYGVTVAGGSANQGTVFRFDPATERLRVLHAFTSPAGGSHPFGGLVQAGGSLYGVTARGPGGSQANSGGGTIFHVVLATGDVVTDATFQSASLTSPAGPLALGPDGRLYGVTSGNAVYAFDPATRGLARVQTLTAAVGTSPKSLTLGSDGRLYGNASAGGAEGHGTIFRYAPATNSVELVYSMAPSNGVDGRAPGPLFAAADGHFYGATTRRSDGSVGGTLFRLRAGAGGTFAFEPLRQLERFVDGSPWNSVLTQGADGLIYGSATSGPTQSGTLFRFDPLASGPPTNPIAFTVLHTFPCTGSWFPSSGLTLAPDGFLYGTTDYCGASFRGAVYRLAPATGAMSFLGDIPGAPSIQGNSALVPGPDGRLYGTSKAYASPNFVTSIIRVDPSTGAVTVAVGAVATPSPLDGIRTGLVRSSTGQMFGVRREASTYLVYRFDPVANAVSTAASFSAEGLSELVALESGDVVAVAGFPRPGAGTQLRHALVRLNPAAPSGYEEVAPDLGVATGVSVVGADGNLYGGSSTPTAIVRRVHPTTGAVSTACTLPVTGTPYHLSVAGDGAVYGVVVDGGMARRLFRCDPATGAVALTILPPDVDLPIAPMTRVGDQFYGVSHGRPGLQLGDRPGGAIFQLAAAGATLPPIDSDADSLSNAWETAYGLDPFDGSHGSGPADDPDGDGRTNAQELADGTHPRGVVTRLFAEGAANAFFRTRFDLANASIADSAIVRARFLTDTGATVASDVVVPRLGHLGLDPSTLPGMPQGSFSAIFESDTPTVVDRTMSWDATGYGSHLETGIVAPSATWYFAEGSTSGEFSLFYLLQNPQATAVTATVRYLRPSGQAPIDRTYTLPPASRTTIVVDAQGAELASTDVSAVISATAPIVAERAMYVNRPGQPFAAGHESAGVTAPALDWFLAEGATGAFFDLFVLIANPSTTAATIDVEYLRSSGPPLVKTYVVPAQSRITIWVDDEQLPAGSGQRPLAQGSVSTAVHVTNGVPVIVERAMWWPGPETTANFWYEAHNSPGATGAATRWLIGGGAVLGADDADTYVLIANTADRAGQATLYLLTDGAGSFSAPLTIDLAPKSRTTVSLGSHVPRSTSEAWYGVLIESSGAEPVPIVVERATYASPGGVFWGRGGNALASPLP